MPEWVLLPEQGTVTVVDAGRALVPVQVRNQSPSRSPARLVTRITVGAAGAGPVPAGWVIVPGQRQSVDPGQAVRFQVLVDPPPTAPPGQYVLTLQLVLGPAGNEQPTDIVATVPVFVGAAWEVRSAGSFPRPTGGVPAPESVAEFLVVGPPGAPAGFGVVPQDEVVAEGNAASEELGVLPPAPTRFFVSRPRIVIPPTGSDLVDVIVRLGGSPTAFHAVLMDGISGAIVARSATVSPIFDLT